MGIGYELHSGKAFKAFFLTINCDKMGLTFRHGFGEHYYALHSEPMGKGGANIVVLGRITENLGTDYKPAAGSKLSEDVVRLGKWGSTKRQYVRLPEPEREYVRIEKVPEELKEKVIEDFRKEMQKVEDETTQLMNKLK